MKCPNYGDTNYANYGANYGDSLPIHCGQPIPMSRRRLRVKAGLY
jgi:hypothetical protein